VEVARVAVEMARVAVEMVAAGTREAVARVAL
jgi:hypothetical protein